MDNCRRLIIANKFNNKSWTKWFDPASTSKKEQKVVHRQAGRLKLRQNAFLLRMHEVMLIFTWYIDAEKIKFTFTTSSQ